MKLQVIGYVRVSTEEQATSGLSLENQELRIRAYAQAADLELLEIISDRGRSAKDLDRPGMLRVLNLVAEQSVDGVIILKLDRLTRSVRDLGGLIELFEENGVAMISVQESINTATAAGRLVANVLGSVAQWEREAIGERTKSALAVKRLRGEKTGGTCPYGFDVGEGGVLAENPEERNVVATMLLLRREGKSWRGIAATLNERGVGTKKGRPWHGFSVQRIVEREVCDD